MVEWVWVQWVHLSKKYWITSTFQKKCRIGNISIRNGCCSVRLLLGNEWYQKGHVYRPCVATLFFSSVFAFVLKSVIFPLVWKPYGFASQKIWKIYYIKRILQGWMKKIHLTRYLFWDILFDNQFEWKKSWPTGASQSFFKSIQWSFYLIHLGYQMKNSLLAMYLGKTVRNKFVWCVDIRLSLRENTNGVRLRWSSMERTIVIWMNKKQEC